MKKEKKAHTQLSRSSSSKRGVRGRIGRGREGCSVQNLVNTLAETDHAERLEGKVMASESSKLTSTSSMVVVVVQ